LYAGILLTVFAIVQIPSGLVLQTLLRRFPSRLPWLLAASALLLVGLVLILIPTLPWLAAILCGFGCGTLFALGTLLPIDAAANPQEAASWAAMTQSAGYLIGALGPLLIGWVSDATHRFGSAVLGLIVVTLMLMTVQLLVVPRRTRSTLNLSIRR
jgi:CP family cyanate transporter-like MFS transporter